MTKKKFSDIVHNHREMMDGYIRGMVPPDDRPACKKFMDADHPVFEEPDILRVYELVYHGLWRMGVPLHSYQDLVSMINLILTSNLQIKVPGDMLRSTVNMLVALDVAKFMKVQNWSAMIHKYSLAIRVGGPMMTPEALAAIEQMRLQNDPPVSDDGQTGNDLDDFPFDEDLP